MSQKAQALIDQSRDLNRAVIGAEYYASVGGIPENGSVTNHSIDMLTVDEYNMALIQAIERQSISTEEIFNDIHVMAMDELSLAVDNLVSATSVIAEAGAVAEIASNASGGTSEQQAEAQQMLATGGFDITQQDVQNVNDAAQSVEFFAQQAAAFLSAANNTSLTAQADDWAAQNNVDMMGYSVGIDVASDIIFLEFMTANNGYIQEQFSGYLSSQFKTADEIYQTGIAYGG